MFFCSNLLRDYLTNYEITIDKKESNLLPSFCITDTSSCSSSSEESTDSELFKSDFNTFNSSSTTSKKASLTRAKKYTKKIKKKTKQTKWSTYWNRYKRFLHSPFVHFIYDTIFNLLFLILFSYTVLCEFTYYETVIQYTDLTSNSTSSLKSLLVANSTKTFSYVHVKQIKAPSWIEYLLIYWMFAFMLEELRQVNLVLEKILN